MGEWGACYFDHFVRFLGPPAGRTVFEQNSASPSIQILSFDNVFADCRVFATLGLSHYSAELGNVGEVFAPVDNCWNDLPAVLANALFYMVQHNLRLGSGIAIEGIRSIHPQFALKSQKAALYLTNPFGMPIGFETVSCGSETGRIYLGFLLSEAEMQYFSQNGADAFESLIESKNVDPYHLKRASSA